jgi:Mg-chelatase subunit ChlI
METTSNIVIEESKSVDIQSSKSDVMKLLDLDSKFRIEGVKGDLHDSLSLLEESVWTPDLPTIRNSSLFQYDSKDEEEESEDEEEESEDEEEESEKEEESEDEEGENEKKETKNENSLQVFSNFEET